VNIDRLPWIPWLKLALEKDGEGPEDPRICSGPSQLVNALMDHMNVLGRGVVPRWCDSDGSQTPHTALTIEIGVQLDKCRRCRPERGLVTRRAMPPANLHQHLRSAPVPLFLNVMHDCVDCQWLKNAASIT
jgi:hypothetical protein